MPREEMSPVAVNQTWEEHVKKENRVIKLRSEFKISSPAKLSIYPEKPNNTVPNMNVSEESVLRATQTLKSMSTLRDGDTSPADRFALPITANMEYGFFSARPVVPVNTMFSHGSTKADVTTYANEYVRTAGTGPYNNKDAGKA
ncbi:hypothetical protein FOA52_010230 [Chlamydomonas sp. UWO 241]|nr:hypothetical protein FOA52_010230 [Chlamydomonas sp. UWO 241]